MDLLLFASGLLLGALLGAGALACWYEKRLSEFKRDLEAMERRLRDL